MRVLSDVMVVEITPSLPERRRLPNQAAFKVQNFPDSTRWERITALAEPKRHLRLRACLAYGGGRFTRSRVGVYLPLVRPDVLIKTTQDDSRRLKTTQDDSRRRQPPNGERSASGRANSRGVHSVARQAPPADDGSTKHEGVIE